MPARPHSQTSLRFNLCCDQSHVLSPSVLYFFLRASFSLCSPARQWFLSLLHGLSSGQTWTLLKRQLPGACGVLSASCAVSVSAPSWWLLHSPGPKANITLFSFNKMNHSHVISFISEFSHFKDDFFVLFCQVWVFFFYYDYCLYNEVQTEDTVESLRHSLWALEFSSSPSQPHPQLPVGPDQEPLQLLLNASSLASTTWPFWEPWNPSFTVRSLVCLRSFSIFVF